MNNWGAAMPKPAKVRRASANLSTVASGVVIMAGYQPDLNQKKAKSGYVRGKSSDGRKQGKRLFAEFSERYAHP